MPRIAPETWSSQRAFLLACVGSAVGLGNIWRFPFTAGQNGGGAFVLIYLGFVLAIGLPIAMAELLLGRRGKASPVTTMRTLAAEGGHSRHWMVIGWLSVGMPLAVLAFYSVIASWSLEYIGRAALGWFNSLDADQSRANFARLTASPVRLIFWHTVFVSMTVFAVSRGVRRGLETVAKLLMPALFICLLVMVGYGIVAADFSGAVRFLFQPDFSRINIGIALVALGQAFFSLSVGGGYLITYGAYLPENVSIPKACVTICLADAGVAILAGLAIFPIVLSYGFSTNGGPGLIFESLPLAFGDMAGGRFLGTLFFLLLTFAAFTSAVALLEPSVSWLQEHHGWKRRWTAPAAGALSWTLGVAVALSFNIWSEVRPMGFIPILSELGIFGLLDFVIANFLLPINALLMAVFVAWLMSRTVVVQELDMGDGALFRAWWFITRFVVPVAIVTILIYAIRSNLVF